MEAEKSQYLQSQTGDAREPTAHFLETQEELLFELVPKAGRY